MKKKWAKAYRKFRLARGRAERNESPNGCAITTRRAWAQVQQAMGRPDISR